MTIKSTKISIVIPVYNAEKLLRKCLDSILCQDNSKFEILLVNDGSTDGSGNLCDLYARDNRNVIAIHKENNGPSSARNIGIKKACGDYIAFVDSDDYVFPGFIDVLQNHIKDDNVDVICFGYKHIREHKTTEESNNFKRELTHDDVLEILSKTSSGNFLWYPWNKLYKKSLLENNNILFDLRVKVGEDTLFNLRCFYYASKILNISNPLYVYITNKNSLTQTPYKAYLNDNMQAHFDSRLIFHEENPIGNNLPYYQDIAKYYVEHVLFLLLSNSLNKPNKDFKNELKIIRELSLFDFSFSHYKPSENLKFKKKILINLFKFKLHKPLAMLLNK